MFTITLSFFLIFLTLPTRIAATQTFPQLLPRNTTDNSTEQCSPNERNTFNYINATTSLTIQGFQPPGFEPRVWDVNFGLKDTRNATNNTSSEDFLMWIDSPATDDTLDSHELPYVGCLVSFVMNDDRKSNGSINEADGDGCSGVFSEKCYNGLLSWAKENALTQSKWQTDKGRDENATKAWVVEDWCRDMVFFNSINCTGSEGWEANEAKSIFGNGTDECSDPGVAEGSKLRTLATGVMNGEVSHDYGNYTEYEKWTRTARPYMLVAWLKEARDYSDAWGDARLFCPTTNQIQSGSRKVSAATNLKRSSTGVYLALILSTVTLFGIW